MAPAPADAGAAFFVRIDHSVGASLITDQRRENPVIFWILPALVLLT